MWPRRNTRKKRNEFGSTKTMNESEDGDDKATSTSPREEWRNFVTSGTSAIAYGSVSLMTVCLNHQVLDTWTFPSSTLILSVQVALTLLAATWARWSFASGGSSEEEEAPSDLVSATAPKLAILFVTDVALGLGATRWLGLDALATLRRFVIPFAMHLGESKPSWSVFFAVWSMVLGPLLGVYFDRPESDSEDGLIFWNTITWQGGLLSIASALVSAARIVLLRRALTITKARHRLSSFSSGDGAGSASTLTPTYHHRQSDGLRARTEVLPVVITSSCPPDHKHRRAVCRASTTSNPTDVVLALLARTSALSLPLVLAFGASFDFKGIETAFSPSHRYLWLLSGDFLSYFVALVTLGPVHEAALYACVYYNTALTTLVAGGFKATALATYRALVSSAFGGEHHLDRWDAVSLAISSAASFVYTYAWYTDQLPDDSNPPWQLNRKQRNFDDVVAKHAATTAEDEEERRGLLLGEEDEEE